jgi:hypothetical protein
MVSPKYCILGVEGPHDQAFVGKLLEMRGFTKFDGQHKNIDPFWQKFIPSYPLRGRLYARLDMPSIFVSHTHSVAVYQGEGSNLCPNLIDKMGTHQPYTRDIHAFGLIIDADDHAPNQIAKEKADKVRALFPLFPEIAGAVMIGKPRTGIYVLPDNAKSGVLESILVKCASVTYTDVKAGAEQFIESIDAVRKSRWRPFDSEKALIACIVSILRPGMSNTSSIAQDEWVCNATVSNVNEVAQLSTFLEKLLGLS